MRGMGIPEADVSSRTIRYSSGYSCSVTGFDRVVAIAILSENQYMARLKPRPISRPIHRPLLPPKISSPTTTKRAPRAAMSTQVLTLFTFISSFGHRLRAPYAKRPPPPGRRSCRGISRRGRLLAERDDDRRLKGYSPSLAPGYGGPFERVLREV